MANRSAIARPLGIAVGTASGLLFAFSPLQPSLTQDFNPANGLSSLLQTFALLVADLSAAPPVSRGAGLLASQLLAMQFLAITALPVVSFLLARRGLTCSLASLGAGAAATLLLGERPFAPDLNGPLQLIDVLRFVPFGLGLLLTLLAWKQAPLVASIAAKPAFLVFTLRCQYVVVGALVVFAPSSYESGYTYIPWGARALCGTFVFALVSATEFDLLPPEPPGPAAPASGPPP